MEHDVNISNEGDIFGKLNTSDLINIEIEDPERRIDELNETISGLKLEVQQLHNVNDEMKEDFQMKIVELTTHSNATVLQKEEELAATLAEVGKKMIELSEVNTKYTLLSEQASTLSSKLREEENKIRDWEAKTMGLREMFKNSQTAISNNVLLWISIQLDTTHETCIHDRVNEHFLDKEIENAKDILFDVCGGIDTAIGPKESRRGGKKENKKEKDCKDIVEALKTLREEGTEPLVHHAMPEYNSFIG